MASEWIQTLLFHNKRNKRGKKERERQLTCPCSLLEPELNHGLSEILWYHYTETNASRQPQKLVQISKRKQDYQDLSHIS